MPIKSGGKNSNNGVIDGKLQLNNLEVSAFGHHITSQIGGSSTKVVYAGMPVTDVGGNGSVQVPFVDALETRVVTHGNVADSPEIIGDFTHEFIGTTFSYTLVPLQGYVMRGLYHKTGSVAATVSVRVRAYIGNDTSGTLYFTKMIPASILTTNTEMHLELPDFDYAEGQEYHVVFDSVENFSLMTNVAETLPWRAVDRQKEHHESLIPASLVFKPVLITSPTMGATGISLTPTITTKENPAVNWYHARQTAGVTPSVGLVYRFTTGVSSAGDITQTNGRFTLPRGKYELSGQVAAYHATADCGNGYQWYNVTSGVSIGGIGSSIRIYSGGVCASAAIAVLDVTETTEIELKCVSVISSPNTTLPDQSYVTIKEVSQSKLTYIQDKTQIQVKRASDQTLVFDSSEVVGLAAVVSPALTASTLYQVRARHKTATNVFLPWSDWQSFTTA